MLCARLLGVLLFGPLGVRSLLCMQYGLLSACCAVAGSVWAVRSGAGGGAPYVGRLNECDSIFHIMSDIAGRDVYTE